MERMNDAERTSITPGGVSFGGLSVDCDKCEFCGYEHPTQRNERKRKD